MAVAVELIVERKPGARLVHERWGSRLDADRDQDTAIQVCAENNRASHRIISRRAAIAFTLIHARGSVAQRRDGEFASISGRATGPKELVCWVRNEGIYRAGMDV